MEFGAREMNNYLSLEKTPTRCQKLMRNKICLVGILVFVLLAVAAVVLGVFLGSVFTKSKLDLSGLICDLWAIYVFIQMDFQLME